MAIRRNRSALPDHIKTVVEDFGRELTRRDLSRVTINHYKDDVELFALWLEETYGDKFDVSKVVQREIVEYRAFLTTTQHASPATTNRRLASLSSFFKYCAACGLSDGNPANGVKSLNIIDNGPRSLDTAGLRRLLREAHVHGDTRDIAIIELLCHTGLRVSEVVALDVGDIDISERKGLLRVVMGKGRTYREVPVNIDVRRAVATYIAVRPMVGSKSLFIGQRGDRMTPSGIWRVVKHYAALAGVPDMRVHDLRHTALTRLVRECGTDMATVAKISGHRDLKTLFRYATPTREDMAEAMDKLAFTD